MEGCRQEVIHLPKYLENAQDVRRSAQHSDKIV